MTQPEALRLADNIEAGYYGHCPQAAAELRRLHAENERLQTRYEACDKALRQWLDKTAWIQETGRGCELGMHRADAVRRRLSAVEAQRDALLEVLKEVVPLLEEVLEITDDPEPGSIGHKARAAIKAVEEGK